MRGQDRGSHPEAASTSNAAAIELSGFGLTKEFRVTCGDILVGGGPASVQEERAVTPCVP